LLLMLTTSVGLAVPDLRRELFDPAHWYSFDGNTGLPPNPISSIVELEDGTVWAAALNAVYWYDGYRWKPGDGLPHEKPVQLIAYDRSQLLIRFAASLHLGGTKGFRSIPLPEPHTITFAVLKDRTIVAHTIKGFRIFDNSRWKDWEGPLPALPAHYFQSILSDYPIPVPDAPQLLGNLGKALATTALRSHRGGHLMAKNIVIAKYAENARGEGVASVIHPIDASGIWEWGPGVDPVLRIATSSRAESLTITPDGEALAYVSSSRVYHRNRGTWRELDPRPPIFHTLRYFQSGANGRLWFSDDNGLHLYQRGQFLWETMLDEDAGAGSISQMIHRGDGSWWIAAEAGLVILSPKGEVTIHSHVGSESIVGLTSIAEDAKGHIWISSGRTFQGAFRWDGGQWKHYHDAQGLHSGPVHRIFPDTKGRLWFASTGNLQKDDAPAGGAWVFDNGQFKRFGVQEGMPNNRVYSIAEDPAGEVWFAGATFLSSYHHGSWTHVGGVRQGAGLFTLAIDSAGNRWVGDRANGLGLVNAAGARRMYTRADGLIANSVYEVLADRDTIWAATRSGLSALRGNRFFSFGSSSGLHDTRIWPLAKSRQGRICVGGSSGGVYCLSPEFDRWPAPRITAAPPALATSGLDFRWTAASFWARIPQNEIQTRYRLDNQPWSDWLQMQTNVVLPAPSPGAHQLQVQARGPFGAFDQQGVTVPFEVPFPYYRTAAFLIPVSASLIAVTALGWIKNRRRTEYRRSIESSEKRFRALIEHSADCIVLSDRNWNTKYVSPSVTGVTGFTPEEILQQSPLDLLHPDDREERGRRRASVIETPNVPFTFRMRIRHKNGLDVWIEGTTCNLLEEPSIESIVTNFRDVTARVHAEEALTEARSQAEEASRAKSSFLATMSHEIRTPMNGILGITDLLATTPLNVEQKENFEIIRKSARALLRIINDILDLSRIEAGALRLENAPFSLRELISDVQNLLSHSAREKGIHLETVWLTRIPTAVLGDGPRLRQVLMNLAGNAIKFTDRGTVSIKVSATEMDEGKVRLNASVCDTGMGIAPDKLEFVFSKFAQADTTTTRRHDGSGLGLAIAKSLMELMGGSIHVQSKIGVGSEFTLSVDLQVQQQSTPGQPHVPDPALTRLSGTVLVVEDNQVNQMVATRLLSRLGCLAEVASNGREALTKLENGSYNAVLMDCHMPEMDGYEAAREIRNRESGRRTPIIAMTANAMSESQRECMDAGMDAFIAKPVGIAELHAALSPFLDQSAKPA